MREGYRCWLSSDFDRRVSIRQFADLFESDMVGAGGTPRIYSLRVAGEIDPSTLNSARHETSKLS
jgi:hypothetical protein